LDLSGLRLTRVGINCCDVTHLLRSNSWGSRKSFWPECLPGALEELELLDLHDGWLRHLARHRVRP